MSLAESQVASPAWTKDQRKRVIVAILICLTLLVAVFAIGWAGLRAGAKLAAWYWANSKVPDPIDVKNIRGPYLFQGNENYLLVKVLGIGAAGVSVKLAIDLLQWLSALIQPVVDLVEKGIPADPLPTRKAVKNLAMALFNNWKLLSAVFGAALSLNLAAGTLQQPSATVTPGPNNTYYISPGGTSFFFQVPPTPETLSGRAFVVLFEEDKDAAAAAVAAGEQSGLQYSNKATPDFLELFATRLAACNRAGKHVKATIKGFASSSGEDADNKALAEARAGKVAKDLTAVALKASGSETPSEFHAHSWASFDAMRSERGFEDRIGADYSEARGQMNRRAEIIIDDAGGCSR